jgi:hypothetical protein
MENTMAVFGYIILILIILMVLCIIGLSILHSISIILPSLSEILIHFLTIKGKYKTISEPICNICCGVLLQDSFCNEENMNHATYHKECLYKIIDNNINLPKQWVICKDELCKHCNGNLLDRAIQCRIGEKNYFFFHEECFDLIRNGYTQIKKKDWKNIIYPIVK